jgi:hypothetical protein
MIVAAFTNDSERDDTRSLGEHSSLNTVIIGMKWLFKGNNYCIQT